MSNNWQPRPFEKQNGENSNNTTVRRTGSLLRDYGQPQQLQRVSSAKSLFTHALWATFARTRQCT